jgi:hypothetical protein
MLSVIMPSVIMLECHGTMTFNSRTLSRTAFD